MATSTSNSISVIRSNSPMTSPRSQTTTTTTEGWATSAPTASPTATHAVLGSVKSTLKSTLEKSDSNDWTVGEISGIAAGLSVLLILVIVGVLVYRHRQYLARSFLRSEARRHKNFETSLYAETHQESLSYTKAYANSIMEGEARVNSVSISMDART